MPFKVELLFIAIVSKLLMIEKNGKLDQEVEALQILFAKKSFEKSQVKHKGGAPEVAPDLARQGPLSTQSKYCGQGQGQMNRTTVKRIRVDGGEFQFYLKRLNRSETFL